MKSNNISVDDLPSPDQLQSSSTSVENLPTPQSLGYTPPAPEGSNLEDIGRGLAQGVTLGSADEIEGAIKAAKHVDLQNLISNKKDELDKLKKLYKQYQKASEQEYINSRQRSPYLYGAGEIAGTIAPAVLSGGAEALAAGGAKLAAEGGIKAALPSILEAGAKGAAIGATTGAMGSEGGIIGATPEEQQKLISDTSQGAITGGALGSGGAAAGKALGAASEGIKNYINKAAQEKPFLSQLIKSKELGEQGINLNKRSDLINKLYPQNLQNSQNILEKINNADQMLGEQVSNSIQKATQDGVSIDISPELQQKADVLSDYFKKNPAISLDNKSKTLFDNIINNETQSISPPEALVLRDQMDQILGKMQGDNSTLANYTKEQVASFRKSINDSLKEQIPAYKDASERFQSFRQLVPESIIGKGVPQDISGIRMGDLRNPDSKLLNGIQNIVEGSELPGSATTEAKQTLGVLGQNLNELEQKEAERIQSLPAIQNDESSTSIFDKLGSKQDFLNNIREASDTSAVLKQATGMNPQEGSNSLLKGIALSGTTGRGKLLGAANIYGLAKNSPVTISRTVFNLPRNSLDSIASTFASSENPTISSLGKHLVQGLKENNNANVNAALFSLLQNKDARATLYGLIPQPEQSK